MSDTPIPTGPSLLGAWFFDERFYDAGRDRVTPLNPVGYPAELKNGVTVGVAGDPSRDFGAADFDRSGNQFAETDLVPDTDEFMYLTVAKLENDTDAQGFVSSSFSGAPNDPILRFSGISAEFVNRDSSGNKYSIGTSAVQNKFTLYSASVSNGVATIRQGKGESQETLNTDSEVANGIVRVANDRGDTLDGEMAAAAVYDLSVPNAPEPSEIAERWDRLTDIPATR